MALFILRCYFINFILRHYVVYRSVQKINIKRAVWLELKTTAVDLIVLPFGMEANVAP